MIKVKLIFWEDGQRKERGRESKAILTPCICSISHQIQSVRKTMLQRSSRMYSSCVSRRALHTVEKSLPIRARD